MSSFEGLYRSISLICWPVVKGTRVVAGGEKGRAIMEGLVPHWRWLGSIVSSVQKLLTLLTFLYLMFVLILTLSFFAFIRDGAHISRLISIWIVLYAASFSLELVASVTRYCESPDGQALGAGYKAERKVKGFVSKIARATKGRDFHNLLVVVNKGTSSEFSMEMDHVLITERNVFMLETKYKSGTVFVNADAPVWRVQSRHGESSMRNALLQVKNTCKQFERFVAPGVAPIPIVVITSDNEVTIDGGISNVVTPENLPAVIAAFDRKFSTRTLDSAALCNALLSKVDGSAEARRRHKERANSAKTRAQDESITGRASI
ncbi:nuclease-related domain-containing protein [Paraburkholderia sp. J67]|uniref:nuclease-related domain-containing protein n=1 Tax=Paraburkholderia sp. J67 TaxID=2805435 RepID=UPI002ABD3608|nr:nuclease-related domain-containing protein [Paraburkholderia sp. J67]